MAVNDLQKTISTALREKLEREAAKMFDEMKKKMIEDFTAEIDLKRDEIVASVAVKIARTFNIHTGMDDVTISFNKGDLR